MRTCRKCGATDVATIAKKGHAYSVTSTKDGTCVSKGSQTKKCSRCGHTVTTSTGYGAHSYGAYKTSIAPTCSSTGTAASTCKYCKDVVTKSLAKDSSNHSNIKTTRTEPTCTKAGSEVTKCNGCGKQISSKTLAATGHSYGGWTTKVDATCTTDGTREKKCKNCPATKTESIISPGHDFGNYVHYEGNCMNNSKDVGTCSRCGKKDTIQGPKGSHTYGEYVITTEGTCITNEVRTRICIYCKTSQTKVGDKKPDVHVGIKTTPTRTVDNGVYHISYYACSGCGKEIITKTSPCDCHHHSMYAYYGGHTPQGHMKYYSCYAGDYSYSSGHYEKDPSCPSCTNAPGVKILDVRNGDIFSSGSIKIKALITDNENDKLTLKYYLDGNTTPIETKEITASRTGTEVTFTTEISIATLTEGVHNIKITADDPISPQGNTTLSFLVDKTAPEITQVDIARSESGLNFLVDASDNLSEVVGYKFTINGASEDFADSSNYAITGLSPDTAYTYKVEVLNGAGLVSTREGTVSTCATVPEVKPLVQKKKLKIKINSENPDDTVYEVKLNDSFISHTETGFNLSDAYATVNAGNEITVDGLAPDTVYDIRVTALGKDGLRYESETTSIKTERKSVLYDELPSPVVSGCAIGTNSAFVSWGAIEGAISYELEIDGDVYNLGNTTEYTLSGLLAGSRHEYRVRARNSYTKSKFSDPIMILEDSSLPAVPVITSIIGQGEYAKITWEPCEGAEAYDLEINGEIISGINAIAYVYRSNVVTSSVSGGAIVTESAITSETAIEVENTNLLDETFYNGENLIVRVRAVNSFGVSSFSESSSLETGAVAERLVAESLDAPEISVVSAGISLVKLSWPMVADASSYEIFVNGTLVDQLSDNKVTIEGLNAGTEYIVTVKAIDENISSESTITLRTKAENGSVYTDRTVTGLEDTCFNAKENGYYRVRLPLINVSAESRYTVTFRVDADKIQIVDLLAASKERELPDNDGKFRFGGRNIYVDYKDEKIYISVVCEVDYASDLYPAADILIRSLTDGDIVFEVVK